MQILRGTLPLTTDQTPTVKVSYLEKIRNENHKPPENFTPGKSS